MNVYECNGANMFMSWKMECSIQRGGAELNGTSIFKQRKYLHYCTNEKHSLFVLYSIQVDICHFDWRIQLSKQTKLRPTIFNWDVTPVSFGLSCWIQQWQCAFCTAILRHTDTECMCHSVTPKTRARIDVFCSACKSTFRMEQKMHGEWRSVQ